MTKRTITLTGRAPVTIDESVWPIIAKATDRPGSFVNGTPRPDYETDSHQVRVRQHADGRAIVYAVLVAATPWTGTADRRGGELVAAGGDLAAAIERVCLDCNILESTMRDCIADLPAQELV
jgi:hypothetical protein